MGERVEADEGPRGVVAGGGGGQSALAQPVGDAPGQAEQLGVGGEEGLLVAVEDLDQAGELGPAFAGQGEVGAEVEEGDLADLGAGADGLAEAVGEVGASGGGVGLDAADEHGIRCSMAHRRRRKRQSAILYPYTSPREIHGSNDHVRGPLSVWILPSRDR